MKRKVKILILCGGQGKRMGSVTTKIPKPLAKIGNYSILHRKILNYSNQGFNDFIIAVGYKGDVMIIITYGDTFTNIDLIDFFTIKET